NVEEQAPTARLDGVVVAEMIEPGLDLRCGGVRMDNGEVALYAVPLATGTVEPILVRSPLDVRDALLTAEAVLAASALPPRRRAVDPDVAVLARLLLRLDGLFRHTGERLLSVALDPVRILEPDGGRGANARDYVTLDARIVQRPHIEGL
ncbi:MAG: hypothetical protein KC457_34895, partial [Myxococcales bacterium]|nr:hypothetical protein [Myxococcales bacterium]